MARMPNPRQVGWINLASYTALTFALFGYLALVFMNFGYYPGLSWIDQMFGLVYLHSIDLLSGYSSWSFGLYAGIYLSIFLVCFFIANRRRGLGLNVKDTIGLGAAMVFLTEVGITITQPIFLNVYVISAQAGTFLAGFTNLDLIFASLATLVLVALVPQLRSRYQKSPTR